MISSGLRLSLILLLLNIHSTAFATSWDEVASQQVTLFFPGSASWESMLIKSTHDGAKGVRNRESCFSCHEGEESEIGSGIATNQENSFHTGEIDVAHIKISLQIMHDESAIYFRIGLPNVKEGQLSLMLDDGVFESSALSGCWSACHADAKGMPSAGKMQLTKYMSRSRVKNTKTGGGESYKPDAELIQLLENGVFVEILGAKFSPEVATGLKGHVLEARHMTESFLPDVQVQRKDSTTYVIIRRLLTTQTPSEKTLVKSEPYSIGLALHINGEKEARHLVSLPINFVMREDNQVQIIQEE